MTDPDQQRRRTMIREIITGIDVLEARRTQYERFDENTKK